MPVIPESMPPTTGARSTRTASTTNPSSSSSSSSSPSFSPDQVTVIFVLGGPGAGKGTQCENIVAHYDITHLSAGDLLRAEQAREGSEYGQMISEYLKNGAIVPMEVTVALLEKAMKAKLDEKGGKGRFLIDGFPRKMDQALFFEETVVTSKFTLFLDCPEEEMQKRLLNRGKTSGRSDDNEESIKKRFRVFLEQSMPAVDYYERDGRVVKVPAVKSPEEVFEDVKAALAKQGIHPEN